MQTNSTTSRQKSKKEPPVPKESERSISDDEIARLTAIIVPAEASSQLYDSDEVALALIRLVAGLAQEGNRHEAAFLVTRGCFHRTAAHNKALDVFTLEGLTFKAETLKSEPERVQELQEMKERARR